MWPSHTKHSLPSHTPPQYWSLHLRDCVKQCSTCTLAQHANRLTALQEQGEPGSALLGPVEMSTLVMHLVVEFMLFYHGYEFLISTTTHAINSLIRPCDLLRDGLTNAGTGWHNMRISPLAPGRLRILKLTLYFSESLRSQLQHFNNRVPLNLWGNRSNRNLNSWAKVLYENRGFSSISPDAVRILSINVLMTCSKLKGASNDMQHRSAACGVQKT